MSGGKGYTFSSDNEDEMNEWINTFQAALKKGHNDQDHHQNDEALDKGKPVNLMTCLLLVSCAEIVRQLLHG